MLKSLGSDMELFAMDRDGHHVALCGKVGGTKQEPIQLTDLQEGFMIQEDNVALEFNIPVCFSREEFIGAFSIMRKRTSNILEGLGLVPSTNASMSFDIKELVHPNALEFGCEPDYNAWTRKENMKPKAKDANLRTCGGHIHVGTDLNMTEGIRNMDLFLGVPSVLLDDTPSSNARRELYGKAGAMRPKPYGFEYRVLSNFWMFNSNLVSWIYTQTRQACEYKRTLSEEEGVRIQNCINTGDKEEARVIITSYGIMLPAL